MTTAFLATLYLAPVMLAFAGMAALSDWIERRFP